MEVTGSFVDLLCLFRRVFTAPTFGNFLPLMTGWVLTYRRRFVTDLIWSSGSTQRGHHSRYHRFFSAAQWSLDAVSKVLATLVISVFVPEGLIEMAGDDTLCRKRGLTLFGAGMHHDPLISSRAKPLVSWGHDWVVLCVLVRCPWAPSKVWALPIAFRLYRNRQGLTKGKKNGPKPPADPHHRTRPQLMVELLELVAGWFPERKFVFSGDSAYGGNSVLTKLPNNVDLISHVHPKGALYAPPPKPAKGSKGAPRKKGKRLPGMTEWANDASRPWKKLRFEQFGLHTTLMVKVQKALYYTAGKDRLLTIILTRDADGKRPDQMFYCTNLAWDAREVLSKYSCRWAIEVTFENSKQHLGLEEPANRKEAAVRRTAPMALLLYSLIVVWFHQTGHRFVKFPDRPWYRTKREPSFADMLTTLRRKSWQEHFQGLLPKTGVVKKRFAQITEFLSLAG